MEEPWRQSATPKALIGMQSLWAKLNRSKPLTLSSSYLDKSHRSRLTSSNLVGYFSSLAGMELICRWSGLASVELFLQNHGQLVYDDVNDATEKLYNLVAVSSTRY